MLSNYVKNLLVLLLGVLNLYMPSRSYAQMPLADQSGIQVGNEWIDYSRPNRYYKFEISTDGIYRITGELLAQHGVPIQDVAARQYALYRNGQRVPLRSTTQSDDPLTDSDELWFYGQKNRSELDQYLFADAEAELLNPNYGLITDRSAYFLTWTEPGVGESDLIETAPNDVEGPLITVLSNFRDVLVWEEPTEFFKVHQKINGFFIYDSYFSEAEGFGSNRASSRTVTLTAPGAINSNTAELNLRLATNYADHDLQIAINGETRLDTAFFGTRLLRFDLPVAIQSETSTVDLQLTGQLGNGDQHVIGQLQLAYDRNFDFTGWDQKSFQVPVADAAYLLEIANFGTNEAVYLLDHQQRTLRTGVRVGDRVQFRMPAHSTPVKLTVFLSTAIQSIAELRQRTFTDLRTSNADYVMITHAALRDVSGGTDFVRAYADYRASEMGGAYVPQIVDVEQIYDQFGYGVPAHPQSIRNFAYHMDQEWSEVDYVFLIGKGREYRYLRTPETFAAAYGTTQLVPTYGWPGSDRLLFAETGSFVPRFAVGRISARTSDQVRIYLDKVRVQEANRLLPQTIEDRLWMKRLVHLGGGNATERVVFASHLTNMERTAQQGKFGAHTNTFFKVNEDPQEVALNDAIFQKINNGCSVMTFMGHSAPGTFDFNIDNPENYLNHGRYPLMFSLGCHSGNIFTGTAGISERFIFYEDKGAIGFIATNGYGFVGALGLVNNQIYESFADTLYGISIGKIMQSTASRYNQSPVGADLGVNTLMQQNILHADPAIKLNPAPGPDYIVDGSSVQLSPKTITTNTNSFKVDFDVVNIGIVDPDSMVIHIVQELPDGSLRSLLRDTVSSPIFRQSLSYNFHGIEKEMVGVNRLHITVDADERIIELPLTAEQNNQLVLSNGQLGLPFFIYDFGATPIYPCVDGVVQTGTVKLQAATNNTYEQKLNYSFQLSADPEFRSILKETRIEQIGGVLRWTPNHAWIAGTTYYWRISPDSTLTNQGYIWSASRFTYLPDSASTWHQQNLAQWIEGEFINSEPDTINQNIDFKNDSYFLRIHNRLSTDPNDVPRVFFNGAPTGSMRPWTVLNHGISFIVANAVDGELWVNPPGGLYGSHNPGQSRHFSFDTQNADDRIAAMNFLKDTIPTGHYVYAFTVLKNENLSYAADQWAMDSVTSGHNLYSLLESQGAALVRALEIGNNQPYAFIFKKDEMPLVEELGASIESVIDAEYATYFNTSFGAFRSQPIGPAISWNSLSWDTKVLESTDTVGINIIGWTTEGQDTLLIENIQSNDYDLSTIDAAEYSYLQLEYVGRDELQRTFAPLAYWSIDYVPHAEVGFDPARNRTDLSPDTVLLGRSYELIIPISNFNQTDAEGLALSVRTLDAQNNTHLYQYPIRKINGITDTLIQLKLDSIQTIGPVTTFLEVETPNNSFEKHKFNNIGTYQFEVIGDLINPLLDVRFDGRSIANGDLVVTQPEIVIELEENADGLLLQDSALFNIKLTSPDGEVRTVRPSDTDVRFYPATAADDNRIELIINPKFTLSGDYNLEVQARDESGNFAGNLGYSVTFEVVVESKIGQVFNYPNPFSSQTQFVYTITGNELPEKFKIQVLTVGGRVVREFTEAELGELRLGTNRSDFTWDGTDQFGDYLANGVYLYRVIARDAEGQSFELFSQGVDQYFSKGFGKLVILR